MGTVLKGGILVELEPARVEAGDLRIDGSEIVARGADLPAAEGDEVISLAGKLVMPGLVSSHHRLTHALARGMPQPKVAPEGWLEQVEQRQRRYERALDLDTVHVSAAAGALEALGCGTTTIFDHHASPKAIAGSLVRVARGLNDVGLRGVLSYEASDRHGALGREEGIEESVAFARKAQGRFRGMIGAGPSFELSADALSGLKDAVAQTGLGVHLPLAEDPIDERLSLERHGGAPVARLVEAGLLSPKSLVAHVVHLAWPELSQLITTGAWLVHAPRSNMQHQAGYAPALKFGARAALGTGLLGPDLFAEAHAAHLRARDAGQPIDVLHALANGHRMASQAFDRSIGPLQPGSVADLLILDYRPPTPLTAENLATHVLFGLGARLVESVMVDGIWRMWARKPLSVSAEVLATHAREAATALWQRMETT